MVITQLRNQEKPVRALLKFLAITLSAGLATQASAREPLSPSRYAECFTSYSMLSNFLEPGTTSPDSRLNFNLSNSEKLKYEVFKLYTETFPMTLAVEGPAKQKLYTDEMNLAVQAALPTLVLALSEAQNGQTEKLTTMLNTHKGVILKCADEVASNSDVNITSTISDAAPSAWAATTQKSKFQDTTDVILQTHSNDSVQCGRYKPLKKMTLQIRCLENTTAILIIGNCHFASGFMGYGDVDLRIDDEKAFVRNMQASTDGQALGLWNGKNAIPIIKRLLEKNAFIVRATPYNESPITLEFSLEGLDEAIKPLRDSCKW